jgi:SSS family transporter
MILTSFIACLAIFTIIGVVSIKYKKNTDSDYLLAGRDLSPGLAGLSAVATTNSGFMFTGWIGLSYMMGLPAIWFMLGLGSGTIFGLFTANKHIRKASVEHNALSYGGLISGWQGKHQPKLRILIGVVILALLSVYGAAQLTAGSKALHVLFDWDYSTGAILGAAIILLYCYSGGLRASVWTDVAQSIVMIAAMGILFIVAFIDLGGFQSFWQQLGQIDPKLIQLFPTNAEFGPLLYIAGWVAAGVGVIGQPHIMVRFMSLNDQKNMNKSLYYYLAWYVTFFTISFLVGLMSRVYLPDSVNFDAELALPNIALNLLPETLVGIILAGLFAASMSTADSIVLSCSASLTRDVRGKGDEHPWQTKLGTLLITMVILSVALWGNKSVFALVIGAWGMLAAAFAPLIILNILKQDIPELTACLMIIIGVVVTFTWREYGLNASIPEALPGILGAFLVYAVNRLFTRFASARSESLVD